MTLPDGHCFEVLRIYRDARRAPLLLGRCSSFDEARRIVARQRPRARPRCLAQLAWWPL